LTALVDSKPLPPLAPPDHPWRRALANPRVIFGGGLILLILLACLLSIPWTTDPASSIYFDSQEPAASRRPPQMDSFRMWMGSDALGPSLMGRCLLGGVISLTIGVVAAAISVGVGVTVGLIAGYRGGWIDGLLMRIVDVLYGLPYILLVILLKIALERPLNGIFPHAANLVVMFLAIGLVSWLTLARVIRGQVLSLRSQPFIEAARAMGLPRGRIFFHHLLPNLAGPIIVYATLTIPQAILQESLLSFLGIGIQPPLPSWGSLAADGLGPALNPVHSRWWLLVFPCTLLAVTLLSLNFVGDGLRDALDPKREAGKI
jgi:oligopeptide transport system permease protein